MKRFLQLSRHSGRVLFMGFNALVLLAIIGLGAALADYIQSLDDEIAQKQQVLGRLEAILAREGDVRAASERIKTQLTEGDFLKGANEGVIAAELQIRLKSVAERNGARVLTMQGLTLPADDVLRYIGAKIALVGTHQQLQKAIYEIEADKPYLFIRNASLKPTAGANGTSIEPTLEAHLDVTGTLPKNVGQP
ncbi:type II secretion system protein GspM [Bradyrhizobium yuanmingense]|uniref:type II secretion system protein GspM n=1 Tax=Bradyrhizobium yuanmingense TaxID=108015 RepID=UPI00056326C5|nr:type II secretion system protein GspM [Bradyrhizobium yuanmingense]